MAWRISVFFYFTDMELQDELITESGKTDREFAVATVRREVVKAICPTWEMSFFFVLEKTAGQQTEFNGLSKPIWRAVLLDYIKKSHNVKFTGRNACGRSKPSIAAWDGRQPSGTTLRRRSAVAV